MATLIRGNLLRSNQVSEDSLIRDVSKNIDMFTRLRYRAPLTVLLNKLNKKRPVRNMKYERFADDFVAYKSTVNSTVTITGTAQTLPVAERALFKLGDVIVNASTLKRVRVASAVSGSGAGNLTVDCLDAGGTFTAAEVLIKLGMVNTEGGVDPAMIDQQLDSSYNYCQIQDTAISISEIADESDQYGGPAWIRLMNKKTEEHAMDMERTLIWSIRSTGTASSQTYWTTGGLLDPTVGIPTANIKDLNGASFDKATFEKVFLKPLFENGGSPEKWVIASSGALVQLSSIYEDKYTVQVAPGSNDVGFMIRKIHTPLGDLSLFRHAMMTENYIGTTWANSMFILDPDYIGIADFRGLGGMKLFQDRQDNNVHTRTDVYHSIYGLDLRMPDLHMVIYNFDLN